MNLLKDKNNLLILIFGALFIVVNSFLVAKDIYWLALFPLVILIASFYFISLDKIFYLITFLTPLAVDIDFAFDLGVSLPTEPLMAVMLFLIVIKLLMENDFDYAILVHPISIVIYFYLFWIFFTSITSTMPLVSFKFLAAKLWFIIPIFFFGVYVFKRKRNIDIFLWSFGISLAIVVFYSSILLASHGFDKNVAHWIMWPFFNDHTAYGAVLAIFIPVFFALGFKPKYNKIQKVLSFLLFAIILTGLYLSASRAAWLSVVIAFGVYIMIIFKIKFRWAFSGLLLMLVLFFAFQTRIMMKLEQNNQDSAGDNFVKHIQSVTNIATDASNLERINRWKSAIRMYKEKPLVGWGPGTYQFVYAPFQHSEDKTIISTNAGNKGNAHSEYLGALSEQGIPGMLLFSLILIMVSLIAIKNHYRIIDKDLKIINLALYLGLITYFAHSFFNNFLDTDKASVPFWGFIAAIVAIDIYAKKSNKNLVNENNNI